MWEREKLFRILWWLYMAFLLLFVALKFDGSLSSLTKRLFAGEASYNLRPFKTLTLQWQYFSSPWGRRNMLGNLLPFIPPGLITPRAFPRLSSFRRFFAFSIKLVLFIEFLQLSTRLGSFDVDDILLNLLGLALGYFLAPPRNRNEQQPPGII